MKLAITNTTDIRSNHLIEFCHHGRTILALTKTGEWVQNPMYTRAEIMQIVGKLIFGMDMEVKEVD